MAKNSKHGKISSSRREIKIRKLIDVMKKLRSENGCPWDKEQTHNSLKPFLVEECAELLDAIDDGDKDNVLEELGDILLHVVFHAQIASETRSFDFDDVVDVVTKKLIRRHPHVFGGKKAGDSAEVLEIWREVKKKEKERIVKSSLDGIPRHFPALHRAAEIQKRAAKLGFDWSSHEQIIEKIEEELDELKKALKKGRITEINEEIGDLLFSVVNLSRFLKGPGADELLAATTLKFSRRFKFIEKKLLEKGKTPEQSSLAEMDGLWNEAKKSGVPLKAGCALSKE
jgi:tetrapyrrole methylase family protein/MazG family protein